MSTEDETSYDVSRLSSVMDEIRELLQQANTLGKYLEIEAALHKMMRKLQAQPLQWGDPLYHPKKAGSVFCHAVADPIVVHFVVFEHERKVLITRIMLSRNTFLD